MYFLTDEISFKLPSTKTDFHSESHNLMFLGTEELTECDILCIR